MASLICTSGRLASASQIRAQPKGKPLLAVQLARSRQTRVVVRADSRENASFWNGFVVGGVVFGTLGFLFAPQISKALLGDDQRLKLPRFLEDEQPKDPEQTKQDLVEKIAQLNASIDEVANQLKMKEASSVPQSEESTMKIAGIN